MKLPLEEPPPLQDDPAITSKTELQLIVQQQEAVDAILQAILQNGTLTLLFRTLSMLVAQLAVKKSLAPDTCITALYSRTSIVCGLHGQDFLERNYHIVA